jgi:hypothetical protein
VHVVEDDPRAAYRTVERLGVREALGDAGQIAVEELRVTRVYL